MKAMMKVLVLVAGAGMTSGAFAQPGSGTGPGIAAGGSNLAVLGANAGTLLTIGTTVLSTIVIGAAASDDDDQIEGTPTTPTGTTGT